MNPQEQPNRRQAFKKLLTRADKAYRLRLVIGQQKDGNQPAGVSFGQMMAELGRAA